MQGEDVRQLQIYLNTHNYIVSTSGNGSPNNETTYFGQKTKNAVIKFQIANNLVPDGVVGKMTRSKMN
jgi:peptidoglycan hydrolase-like protein with peptidoglycan-binding domain